MYDSGITIRKIRTDIKVSSKRLGNGGEILRKTGRIFTSAILHRERLMFIAIPLLLINSVFGSIDDPIKIGFAHCLTHSKLIVEANRSLKGLQFAVDDQNLNGGLLHRQIKLEVFDTENDITKSENLVSEMKKKDIKALVGMDGCDDDQALAPLLEAAHIPTVIPGATDPRLVEGSRFLSQILTNDARQAKFLAEKIIALHKKRLILVENLADHFNLEYADNFSLRFKELGGEIVAIHHVHQKIIPFKDAALAIKKDAPRADAILMLQTTFDAVYLWLELKDPLVKVNLPIFATDSLAISNLDLAIKNFKERFSIDLYISHLNPLHFNSKAKAFIKRFNSTFKNDPLSIYEADALLFYDSAMIIFKAIQKSNSLDSEVIAKNIRRIKLNNLLGPIAFESNGIGTRGISFLKITNGLNHDIK